jgi:indolepyruvate ferredoxin oxidoreductase
MVSPLDGEVVREFAAGLDEIVVVEEKGPFLETAVKDALYGSAHQPLVVGERDDRGAPLVPATGVLSPDVIARAVGRRLLARTDLPHIADRLTELDAIAQRPAVCRPGADAALLLGLPAQHLDPRTG